MDCLKLVTSAKVSKPDSEEESFTFDGERLYPYPPPKALGSLEIASWEMVDLLSLLLADFGHNIYMTGTCQTAKFNILLISHKYASTSKSCVMTLQLLT
jgi:hypothetical protein